MTQVGIAAGSQIAADAGRAIAAIGGNAVDSAIAATLVSLCTEPGVVAPGGGGFLTIWDGKQHPIVIDAYAEIPGRYVNLARLHQSTRQVYFEYGGGMHTLIGYGSIATPGILAGLASASQRYGRLPWDQLLQPSINWAKQGFPLSLPAANYLKETQTAIFDWNTPSYQALHHTDGTSLQQGDLVRIPYLAETLSCIATEGVNIFYKGELGRKITSEIQAHGGLLTSRDLASYRAIGRSPLTIRYRDWEIITNPPPAIGGACLAAMLLLAEQQSLQQWDAQTVKIMAQIQHTVLNQREQKLKNGENLLELAKLGDINALKQSPSTIHASTVDSNGMACSVTASAGYGSGVMIAETGLWFNNSLGELELHPQDLSSLKPGSRLISNMAPTIAKRDDGTMLAIGSPGASRITTAIAQVLINFIQLNMSLTEAIASPRLHVEMFEDDLNIAFEPGLDLSQVKGLKLRPFSALSMYFGGVQAALWSPKTGLTYAADPRRAGGVGVWE